MTNLLDCFMLHHICIGRVTAYSRIDSKFDIIFKNIYLLIGSDFYTNNSDIKNEIVAYLDENYAVRTMELIEEIKKKHTNEKGLVERGFNDKSFYRKIKELKDNGEILEIESDQYNIYGIKDSDKRAIYLVLKTVDGRRKFIDRILPLLKSKNEGDLVSTLDEINRYRGKYHLNYTQLTKVVFALQSVNINIVEKTLSILFYYMENQKIIPSDTDLLRENVKIVISRFCRNDTIYSNIYHYCLYILGILKDSGVVDQLLYDASNLTRLTKVAGFYKNDFTAESIEMQREVLFEFERELRTKKSKKSAENIQIANIISEIRTQAAMTVISPQKENGGYIV